MATQPKIPRAFDTVPQEYDDFGSEDIDTGIQSHPKKLICSIRVQIDGNRSEFLNVLEGDNPDLVVRKFA